MLIILAALLIGSVALAGITSTVGELPRVVWSHPVNDPSITPTQYAPVCGKSVATVFAATDGRTRCYVQKGWSVSITHVSMVAVEDHTGTENCHYVLSYSADGTGTTSATDLAGSDLYTDEPFVCGGTTVTVDDQGESCFTPTTPLILTEGSWAHWKITAGTLGTCASSDTYLQVYGEWRKNG